MSVAFAILETIANAGYVVHVECPRPGRTRVKAIATDTGERWIVTAKGELRASIELWNRLGFDPFEQSRSSDRDAQSHHSPRQAFPVRPEIDERDARCRV